MVSGGPRPGAGRKPAKIKRSQFWLSLKPKSWKALQSLAKKSGLRPGEYVEKELGL